jgi:hypothetical protein
MLPTATAAILKPGKTCTQFVAREVSVEAAKQTDENGHHEIFHDYG